MDAGQLADLLEPGRAGDIDLGQAAADDIEADQPQAQAGQQRPDAGDNLDGLEIRKPEDRQDYPSTPAPAGATVLFDGSSTDGLTKTDGKSPVDWKIMPNKALRVTKGGIVSKELPIQVSNLALLDPKDGKPTRVGSKTLADGKKVRVAKRSGEVIDG